MSDRVLIKDHYISEEEKPYYFFASDAIILSYTRQFLSNASSLWEACRFETPVIISDNSQLKEIMDSYKPGLVFKAQDPDSLRETIIHFINLSQEEIIRFKENCRRFNEDFSINRWAKHCLLIYEDHLLST
jgi:glycosyltransferase involved in cell wall biosynthesis